jgi:DNA invertase Pin-like site-specific DNA recombinase
VTRTAKYSFVTCGSTRRLWDPAVEFIDTGISGAKASRPALDKLMAAAARREFDTILVYKLDRFGRSVLHLSQQLAALERYGVRFMAVTQGIDTDASNPASKLLTTILSGVAEFERELIRERTASGLRRAKANGKVLGRPARIFRRDEVARLRATGQSWRLIAKALGVPLSTVRGCAENVFPAGRRIGGKQRPRPSTPGVRQRKVFRTREIAG